jgi:protein tyrosine/serine phosphatase
MAKFTKRPRRALKRVTQAWRAAILAHTPPVLKRWLGPSARYADMLLFDHGIFRILYLNAHALDGAAWRAAQPAPYQIRRFAAKGVRTVVNLRGAHGSSSYELERRACDRYGLKLVDYQVRSRAAPSKDEIRGARDLFQRLEYPVLMHCKSGADRAGLMSVLYLHFHKGVPIAEAAKQLSLSYGHIRQADTGILDYFFERYLADTAERPMAFMDWVEQVYDPEELQKTFTSNGLANRFVDWVLQRE